MSDYFSPFSAVDLLKLGAPPLYSLQGQHPGLLQPGNIDLLHRPVVRNPDGSVSTVRSISVGLDGGKSVLLPTVVGDRVVPDPAAVAAYRRTGQNLGVFASEADANRYAQKLHQQQARVYPNVGNIIEVLRNILNAQQNSG